MAKIYGLFGSMTGKLADTVMSVRYGEQLARKYQPIVSNPSTPAQVAQRAKLKLISQLSAVMSPVITMRRVGSVSSRNLFTKANIGLATYADKTASVNLTGIQLTNGRVGLPEIAVTRDEATLNVKLSLEAGADIDRVVYAMFVKLPDNSMYYAASTVVSEAGSGRKFQGTLTMPTADAGVIVYAYGIRDNNENARIAFGNITVPAADTVANLLTSSTLMEGDVTLTETRAVESHSTRAIDPDDKKKK